MSYSDNVLRESGQILETWKTLSKALQGLIKVAAVNCDEFPNECAWLGVHLCPQVILLAGGEIVFYTGSLTAKSIFIFANNHITSPVAQIEKDLIDWWIKSEGKNHTRKCIVLLQSDATAKIPLAYMSLSRSLVETHSFAEIRDVDQQLKDTFNVKKLPAVLSFPCNDYKQDSLRIFDETISRDSLSSFLMDEIKRPSKTHKSDLEAIDVEQLHEKTLATVCSELCLIVFVDDESDLSEVMKVKKAAKKVRSSNKAKVPKVVWMPTSKQFYSVIRKHSQLVSMVLWKVKRNRVAIFQGTLELSNIVAFIDDAVSGSLSFISLSQNAHDLLLDADQDVSMPVSDTHESDIARTDFVEFVPAGHVSWTCPTNVLQERQGASSDRSAHSSQHPPCAARGPLSAPSRADASLDEGGDGMLL